MFVAGELSAGEGNTEVGSPLRTTETPMKRPLALGLTALIIAVALSGCAGQAQRAAQEQTEATRVRVATAGSCKVTRAHIQGALTSYLSYTGSTDSPKGGTYSLNLLLTQLGLQQDYVGDARRPAGGTYAVSVDDSGTAVNYVSCSIHGK